jgi:hypothetical protein
MVSLVEVSPSLSQKQWKPLTYVHTYIQFHFINPGKSLGFGYETCPQNLTNTVKHMQIKTYRHTNFKILKLRY